MKSMPNKLPTISGQKLISLLTALGYQTVRQKGSHIRLEKITPAGPHKITIPNHNPLAKGTLNDILAKVSVWNQISKEELLDKF